MRWPRFCAVGKGCSESFRGLRGLGDGKRKETGFVPRCVLMKEPTKEWKTPSHVRHAIQGGESAAGEGAFASNTDVRHCQTCLNTDEYIPNMDGTATTSMIMPGNPRDWSRQH